MCVEVRISEHLGGSDGAFDTIHRRLVLADHLDPLGRTMVARSLLIAAGVEQDAPGPTLRCLCGGPLVVEHWPLAG
ncbi:MAG TPA: hypothetical protein VFV01_47820 [Spirillospora sp.]|nr:hypothetical protein [Spirillospora sp.]